MLPTVRKNRRNMDYLDSFFNNSWMQNFLDEDMNYSVPAANIEELKNEYLIDLAIPGANKKDFEIDIKESLLTISFKHNKEKKEEKKNYLRREFVSGSYQRSFELSEDIDQEKIKAEYDQGILKIKLPKKEESIDKGPIKIQVA